VRPSGFTWENPVSALRILLVDDSRTQRIILRRQLAEGESLEVVGEAEDGYEALEKFAGLTPDVVLLDLVMPGMGGEETLRALLEMDPGANVIIVSSVGTRDTVERCLEAGARSFLQKPFDVEDMIRVLGTLVPRLQEVS
jgi:two-component system chemotaxis response regulator CheY